MDTSVTTPAPAEIAAFLRTHPEFFTAHPDVFAEMRVPHPHENRAISLGERQVLALRERQRTLEQKLATFTERAGTNQGIIDKVRDWTLPLLAQTDATALPAQVTDGLRTTFSLTGAALRLWGCGTGAHAWQAEIPATLREEATAQKAPICGTDVTHAACAWLAAAPASVARVPVRAPDGSVFGLLVLGDDDAARFASDMGTDFLTDIGRLAGAALSRLRVTG